MNDPNISAGPGADAATAEDVTFERGEESALRSRVAALEGEINEMRKLSRITAEFYLSGLAAATNPREAFSAMASMIHTYFRGSGIAEESAEPWIYISKPLPELAVGALQGPVDVDLALRVIAKLEENPAPFLATDDAGDGVVVVPVPRSLDPLDIIGVFALPTVEGAELLDDTTVVTLTIALCSAMHVDRVVRIAGSSRSEQYARAAARVQRSLTRPRELGQAMMIAIEALADCDDVRGAAAVLFDDGEARLVATAGEIDDRVAGELSRPGSGGVPGHDVDFARLPVVIDNMTVGAIVLSCNPSLGANEDEMLDSIAVAVAGSAARHRAASTIESLRRSATRRLVEAQERERSMVAADIHDGVLQQLGATAIRLELAQSRVEQSDFAAARKIIEDGAGEIRACARELRALLMELRPQVLDDNGLSAALMELGRNVAGVEIDVTADVPDDLGNEYSITIFRIVQEALNNIQKHAHANHGSVDVTLRGGAIEIEIRDNGIGYEAAVTGPSLEGSHLGLLGMRERARMLGGSFSIEGHSGEGTVIKLRLPLDVGYTGYGDTGAGAEPESPPE